MKTKYKIDKIKTNNLESLFTPAFCVLSRISFIKKTVKQILSWIFVINVKVGKDKPQTRLIVVRRLSVNKGQVLWSGILDTSFSLCVLPLKNGLTQELKIQIRYRQMSVKTNNILATI